MGLSFTVGGARGTFEERFAREVAGILDNAFGSEGDWEGSPSTPFGELAGSGWSDLQRRAVEELGYEGVPNLLALGAEGRGVYLPAYVRAIAFPLSDRGGPLRCASLPGLREELSDLAECWGLSLDDEALLDLLGDGDHDRGESGGVTDPPEIRALARLALAANEAVRRDCPIWLVG